MASSIQHDPVVAARIAKGLARQCKEYASAHTGAVVRLATPVPRDGQVVVTVLVEVGGGLDAQVLVEIAYPAALFKAPVVRFLSPTGVFEVGKAVCINGVTHYHPESWNQTLCLAAVVDSLVQPLLSAEVRCDLRGGIGVLEHMLPGAELAPGSRKYNLERRAAELAAFGL